MVNVYALKEEQVKTVVRLYAYLIVVTDHAEMESVNVMKVGVD